MDQYTEHGYANRDAYLLHLSESTGRDLELVRYLSGLLGTDEDFDALPIALEGCQQVN